jgi:hypothetical protein
MVDTEGKGRESPEEFLSRWSRRKQEARSAVQAPAAPAAPAQDAPPPLPPLESLTADSDFSGFLHPKVDEGLRRAALKKLFSDPQFNVMDGLDTYIDDYSVSDPIPEALLKQLRHAQDIIHAGKERREEAAKAEAAQAEAAQAEAAQAEAETAALPAATDGVAAPAPGQAAVAVAQDGRDVGNNIDGNHSNTDNNNARPRA